MSNISDSEALQHDASCHRILSPPPFNSTRRRPFNKTAQRQQQQHHLHPSTNKRHHQHGNHRYPHFPNANPTYAPNLNTRPKILARLAFIMWNFIPEMRS